MDALEIARLLQQIPDDNKDGYDYAGYEKKYGVPAPYKSLQEYQAATGMHLGDEFKLPGHMTFSNGSIYSQPDIQGGQWQRGGSEQSNLWNFQPSQQNLNQYPPAAIGDYFKNRETKDTTVTLPGGNIIWGKK